MRPGFYPKGLSFDESNNIDLFKLQAQITQLWHLNGRCPEGTIPIRRTKEEDLVRASSSANYERKKHHTTPNDIVQSIHEVKINF